MPEQRILMGVVGRPHGVRGLVHVHSYTADPADLAGYGPLSDDKGRVWTLAWRGEGVAELRDAAGQRVASREAAAALTNAKLYVARALLPEPEDEEYYLADLVGLAARDEAGALVGQVAVVHDHGGGSFLEVARDGAASMLVPFTRAAVPLVDVAGGFLVIAPPAEVAGEAPGQDAADGDAADGGRAA